MNFIDRPLYLKHKFGDPLFFGQSITNKFFIKKHKISLNKLNKNRYISKPQISYFWLAKLNVTSYTNFY